MWTLLKNNEQWQMYVTTLASQTCGIIAAASSFPRQYPCLVSSLYIARVQEVYHAFVYPTDADVLCRPVTSPHTQATTPSEPPPPKPSNPEVSQDQFNRWVAAHVMALTYYVVESGLCGPGGIGAGQAAYENKLLETLEVVDASIRESRTAGAVPYTVLDPKHEATP